MKLPNLISIRKIYGSAELCSEQTPHAIFWAYFGLFAAFVFSNYFLLGHVLISSAEAFHLHLPLLIEAKRAWAAREIPLWDASRLAGVPTYLGGVSPLFSPDNWIQMWVPPRYFFTVGTFLMFARLWFVGGFAYLFFVETVGSRRWAFFAAIAYQLCGYSVSAMLSYDRLSPLLYFTVCAYFIWSVERRKSFVSYSVLTFAAILLAFSSRPAEALYSLAALPVLVVYRSFFRENNSPRRRNQLLAIGLLTLVTTGLVAQLRFLPEWSELGSRPFALVPTELGLRGLRLILPEITGISSLTNYAFPQYFGVVAILLAVWGLLTVRASFWAFAPFLLLFHQHPGLQIFLPITFCTWMATVGKSIEQAPDETNTLRVLPLFLFLTGLTVTYLLFARPPVSPGAFRMEIALVAAGTLGLAGLYYRPVRLLSQAALWAILGAMAVTFVVMIFVRHDNPTFLSHLKILLASLSLLLGTSILFFIKLAQPNLSTKVILRLLFPVALGAIGIALFPWTSETRAELSGRQEAWLSVLGGLRVVATVVPFVALVYWRRGVRNEAVFPLLLALLAFDVIPAVKIHQHRSVNPFFVGNPLPRLNPTRDETGKVIETDFKNFRANRPNLMTKNAAYAKIASDQEVKSSLFAAYGLSSYGGAAYGVPERFAQLAHAFGIKTNGGISADVTNERFLDLVGARYDYDPIRHLTHVRSQSLGRFVFYTHYEVVENDANAIKRLTDPAFVPQDTVLVNTDPGIPNQAPRSHAETITPVRNDSANSVELTVQSTKDGILLFNDNFHEAWHAFVDGSEQPIFRANFAFMAMRIPAGSHSVTFRFEPKVFRWGYGMAVAGGLFFVLIVSLLFLARRPERKSVIVGGVSQPAPV